MSVGANAKVDFIYKMVQAYNAIGDKTYPLSCVIAHAARESAWGTSGLAKFNNLFGVKAGKTWTGPTVDIKTKEEYQAGVLTTVMARWRAYSSYEDCIRDYYNLLSNKRYEHVKEAEGEIDYFAKLRDAGYFTSTTYVSTMQPWFDQVHAGLRGMGYEQAEEREADSNNDIHNYVGLISVFSDLCDYIVDEVISKKYGNGDDRKKQLGEFYDVIQARVNKKLRG